MEKWRLGCVRYVYGSLEFSSKKSGIRRVTNELFRFDCSVNNYIFIPRTSGADLLIRPRELWFRINSLKIRSGLGPPFIPPNPGTYPGRLVPEISQSFDEFDGSVHLSRLALLPVRPGIISRAGNDRVPITGVRVNGVGYLPGEFRNAEPRRPVPFSEIPDGYVTARLRPHFGGKNSRQRAAPGLSWRHFT